MPHSLALYFYYQQDSEQQVQFGVPEAFGQHMWSSFLIESSMPKNKQNYHYYLAHTFKKIIAFSLFFFHYLVAVENI